LKTVSNTYAASMASLLRNRSYVKVRFENINIYAAADGHWVSNSTGQWSDLATLDFEYNYGKRYETLEHNRWSLDGTGRIIPTDFNISDGYVSSQMSGSDGLFPDENPLLARVFSAPHDLLGLTVVWDSRANEWPLAVSVRMYDDEDTELFSQIVQPSSAETYVETNTQDVSKIEIEYIAMLPYRRARMESVKYGMTRIFENKDIQSTAQSHDVDPITRRLPQEKFEFAIIDYDREYDPDNPQGAYEFIDANAPVSVQYGYELPNGTIEWVKADRYKLSGKPSVSQNIAKFSATGLLGSMTGTYYKSTVGSKTLYDMAVSVLQDAHLSPAPDGSDPWVLDNGLQNILTTGVLPIDTHANCLQMIAHAACMKIWTDDDNIIHIGPQTIYPSSYEAPFTLDFTSMKDGSPVVTKINPLKAVNVWKYGYTTAASASEIYKGTITGLTAHIEFSGLAQNVSFTVSGGALAGSFVYGRAADLVFTTEGTHTVTVNGKVLQESSTVYTFEYADDGSIDEEKNPLITNDQMVADMAAWASSWLKMRSTYDADYRGNPELETGDPINMQTRYQESTLGLVLTDEITFNGALSGRVKVKLLEAGLS